MPYGLFYAIQVHEAKDDEGYCDHDILSVKVEVVSFTELLDWVLTHLPVEAQLAQQNHHQNHSASDARERGEPQHGQLSEASHRKKNSESKDGSPEDLASLVDQELVLELGWVAH